jgi:hypothetical protein
MPDLNTCPVCTGDLTLLGRIDLGAGPLCPGCFQKTAARLNEPSALESATNEELIAELLRRTTFRGVIAWQEESFKGEPKTDWRWRAMNCDPVATMQEMVTNLGEKT